jgi:hypothetical protein
MSYNRYGVTAAREHLLAGAQITRLEAMVLYGVPDLTKIISDLRRDGFEVARKAIPFAAALRRVNGQAVVKPPASLPIREIMLTEYWVSR